VKEEQQVPRNINIINEIRIKTATKRIRSSRGVIPELGFLHNTGISLVHS